MSTPELKVPDVAIAVHGVGPLRCESMRARPVVWCRDQSLLSKRHSRRERRRHRRRSRHDEGHVLSSVRVEGRPRRPSARRAITAFLGMVGRDRRAVSRSAAQADRGADRALSRRDLRRRSLPRLRCRERGRRNRRRGSSRESRDQEAQDRDRAASARALPPDGRARAGRARQRVELALQRRVCRAALVRRPRADSDRIGSSRCVARLAGASAHRRRSAGRTPPDRVSHRAIANQRRPRANGR